MADDVEYVTPTRSMLRRYLQRMDPYQFEAFVGDLWERFGWETRVVGEPGDRGIDVILVDGEDLLGLIEEVDGWDVIAAYFDDIELAAEVDRGDQEGDEADAGGLISRIRSIFE